MKRVGDHDWCGQIAKACHRRADGGTPGGEALIRLDRVEAFGERGHHMRHDHHVGMLQVGGDVLIEARPEEMHVGERTEHLLIVAGQAGRTDQHDLQMRKATSQVDNQIGVEPLALDAADVHCSRTGGQVVGSRARPLKVVGVDCIRNQCHRSRATSVVGQLRRTHHDRAGSGEKSSFAIETPRLLAPRNLLPGPVIGDVIQHRPRDIFG